MKFNKVPRFGALAAASLATAALATAFLAGAAPSTSALPGSEAPFPAAQTTLVWVGTGAASIQVDGAWRRVPSQDYEFSVTQRRYGDRWESIKVQHRRHPAYDGSAGPRDQTNYFRVDLPAGGAEPELAFKLASSFGNGNGRIDREFRRGTMEFEAKDISMFAPFNRYRIAQQYEYEKGELIETVELFKRKDGSDAPFMRFEERASLFAPQRFAAAPNKR